MGAKHRVGGVVNLIWSPKLRFGTDFSSVQSLAPLFQAKGPSNIPELGNKTFNRLSHACIIGCLFGLDHLSNFVV